MRVVVDANAIVQACIEAAGLGRLVSHQLAAPPIMASETVSTLREMAFRGDLSPELARIALDRFQALAYEVVQPPGLWQAAWDLSEQLGWAKTYDAEYVALARLLDCPLVTLDARLARGASHIATIIGPAEVPAQ